jgi:hypothetical protein
MLSTQFLLLRAKQSLINGCPVAAAYFCTIAADLAADYGTTAQATACREAARACQARAAAQLLPVC